MPIKAHLGQTTQPLLQFLVLPAIPKPFLLVTNIKLPNIQILKQISIPITKKKKLPLHRGQFWTPEELTQFSPQLPLLALNILFVSIFLLLISLLIILLMQLGVHQILFNRN